MQRADTRTYFSPSRHSKISVEHGLVFYRSVIEGKVFDVLSKKTPARAESDCFEAIGEIAAGKELKNPQLVARFLELKAGAMESIAA